MRARKRAFRKSNSLTLLVRRNATGITGLTVTLPSPRLRDGDVNHPDERPGVARDGLPAYPPRAGE